MPSKKIAQLGSGESSDEGKADTMKELIAAQSQALEHIKKIRNVYLQRIAILKDHSQKKREALSLLNSEPSFEDTTRRNLSKTYDQIRMLQFDIDNMRHKVAAEKSQVKHTAPSVSSTTVSQDVIGLVQQTIQAGIDRVQADLQVVKDRLKEVDKTTKQNLHATVTARDDIITEVQRGAVTDERETIHSALLWDDT